MRRKWYRRILMMLLVFAISAGGSYCFLELKKENLEREAVVNELSSNMLIPGGMPVGIYMEMDGVMILGTDEIVSEEGEKVAPAEHLVKKGDYIVGINGAEIASKKELLESVRNLSNRVAILKVRRENEYIEIKLLPVRDRKGIYKMGIWVRDNAQGLGTITFLNAQSEFGALGHGIHDTDTNGLIEMARGTLYETSIQNIKKGSDGNPGGLEGIIIYNHYNVLGTITKNTEAGIFGKIERIDKVVQNQESMPAASKEEVKTGAATIRCSASGTVKEYEIRITKVDLNSRELNKGIELEVVDRELLDLTGGIVQGMSGSPIIQNGKIVGAVTHVFVQNAAKGYGIFIENMLEYAEK